MRVDDPVVNIPALPTILYNFSFAQHPQLLGNIGLWIIQAGNQVTNTLLAIPEQTQDGNPGRVGQHFENFR